MKRILILIVVVLFTYNAVESQTSSGGELKPGPKLFYFGVGVNVGFFYPSDINDYLEDRYTDYILEFGTYSMIMYYTLNVDGSFFFCRFTELKLELELAASPKMIMTDETDTYFLNRITPALKFNFHIPAGNKVSIYMGPGVNYSRLRFKGPEFDKTRTCLGFSGQAGVMVRFRKFAIQPGITFNYIPGKKEESSGGDDFVTTYQTGLDFSYTGGQIGCTFYF